MDNKKKYVESMKNSTAIDGRHKLVTEKLGEYFSEYALHKYRVFVEIKHLILMSNTIGFNLPHLSDTDQKELLLLYENFNEQDAALIAEYDHFGRNGIGPLEHDVKSVEMFIKEKLIGTKFEYLIPMIHYSLTSEDVNNIAYNCMLTGALNKIWAVKLISLADKLEKIAQEYKNAPLLARTHGQPASPTTFGKEIAVFLKRITNEMHDLSQITLSAKFNGAVGNYNAHRIGHPNIDWIAYSKTFVESFGFDCELLTNQRGPKNTIVKLFQNIMRINTILRDLDIDLWLYISKKLVVQ